SDSLRLMVNNWGILMKVKGLILSVCYIIGIILLYKGDDFTEKISVRNLAILLFVFSIIITILLFYVF
ncbi:hypothetical protein, partial [Methanobrevibacter sp.]|uniref:hypothetical protein n=1 Tax=Methanobrevibacter sp. TaxID=66852 RepID=UPI00388F4593